MRGCGARAPCGARISEKQLLPAPTLARMPALAHLAAVLAHAAATCGAAGGCRPDHARGGAGAAWRAALVARQLAREELDVARKLLVAGRRPAGGNLRALFEHADCLSRARKGHCGEGAVVGFPHAWLLHAGCNSRRTQQAPPPPTGRRTCSSWPCVSSTCAWRYQPLTLAGSRRVHCSASASALPSLFSLSSASERLLRGGAR